MASICDDSAWMQQALALAHKACDLGEVPIGALIVKENTVLGRGWNCPIARHDPSAHAEIEAIRAAGQMLANYRLPGTTLYVTLEPCVMCMGAICQARIERLVFGAYDPIRGAVCHALQLADADFLNHRLAWTGGILEAECSLLLKAFFKARRG
jgi:tRNA(adenine34) deaminase